jgi:hypothetical protein
LQTIVTVATPSQSPVLAGFVLISCSIATQVY